jgi:HlyD family secretion protein
MNKIIQTILKRKIMSGMVLSVIVLGAYFFFRGGAIVETKYVLAAVERGTIVASITGSGQVSALQQVDVKPKVSGNITYVGVKAGQQVYLGQTLAYLDSQDAQRSVRDAQISLESAQISLEKMRRNQQTGGQTTTENLEQSYKDAYNKVSDSFLDLPNLIELSRGILYDNTINKNGCAPNVCEYGNLAGQDFKFEFQRLANRAENDYKTAKETFDPNFQTYRGIRLDASHEEIVDILQTTEKTTELLAQAVKSEQNMLDALVSNINNEGSKNGGKGQVPQQITTYQNSIGSALSNLNSIVLSLGNARRSIESAQRSLEDSALSDPIDVRSQENIVAQRQAALQDVKNNLANYAIRAPFTGIVAKSDIKVGDSASGSTIIATLLTKQTIAQISLNEVDIAQVKVGQKVTLTFDAIENLTITGQVIEVDSLGTVSQGVVTYTIKIGFDTQDERIKSGMSVSAAIITDSRQNVLMIPNSAVKSANTGSYIETPGVALDTQTLANISNSTGISLPSPTQRQTIETGLSNDTMIEVISGLKEGDLVVVRTVTSSATTSTTQNNSLFPSGGRTTGTGGGARTGGF